MADPVRYVGLKTAHSLTLRSGIFPISRIPQNDAHNQIRNAKTSTIWSYDRMSGLTRYQSILATVLSLRSVLERNVIIERS